MYDKFNYRMFVIDIKTLFTITSFNTDSQGRSIIYNNDSRLQFLSQRIKKLINLYLCELLFYLK